MTRNYFTSKANAQETMRDNFYKRVKSFSDSSDLVVLYFNTTTSASAVLKTSKNNFNKECDTLVQIFESHEAGKYHFETVKNWMK
jgi:hypothetical protein